MTKLHSNPRLQVKAASQEGVRVLELPYYHVRETNNLSSLEPLTAGESRVEGGFECYYHVGKTNLRDLHSDPGLQA